MPQEKYIKRDATLGQTLRVRKQAFSWIAAGRRMLLTARLLWHACVTIRHSKLPSEEPLIVEFGLYCSEA
jgi:hypothetical protein